MKIKKNSFLQNFVINFAGFVGTNLALLAFDLDIFGSMVDAITGLIIVADLLLVLYLVKLAFSWVDLDNIFDGIWIGVVLYCWAPIVGLIWESKEFSTFFYQSSMYLVIGLVVLTIGYFFRRR